MSSVVPMFLGILFLLPSFFGSQWGPTYLIYAFLGAWTFGDSGVRVAMSAYHVSTLPFLPGHLELLIDCAPLFLSLSNCAPPFLELVRLCTPFP